MKMMKVCALALSLAWAGLSQAQANELNGLDTSLAGVQPLSGPVSGDFETIFIKQDKDFPEQVAAMLKAEAAAWEEHSKKLDKSWWNKGIDYCRAYREGYRNSFHNGYRFGQRYEHGYQYQSNYHSPREAYVYSYQYSYSRFSANYSSYGNNVSTAYSAYQEAYSVAYTSGYTSAGQGWY